MRLAQARMLTLFALSLFPAIPLVLVSPFLLQALRAAEFGVTDPVGMASLVSPWTVVAALLGLLLSFFASLASTAGMFVALGSPKDPGPRAAFREGARRWGSYLWTQVLVTLAVLLIMLPGLLFFTWAQEVLRVSSGADSLLATVALLLSLLLVTPAFLVVTWYAFATIPAARGEAWGVAAIRISHQLVRGSTGRVFGFLLAWLVFEALLAALLRAFFPGLPLFTGFVYYVLATVLGSAYLFTVYDALRKA